MAFGIDRQELQQWKDKVESGEIAFLTHFWFDERFPHSTSVTKVGCLNTKKLAKWGTKYGLKADWIHQDPRHPHFDLVGDKQLHILKAENLHNHIQRFNLN